MKILAISDQRLAEMEKQDYLRRTFGDVSLIISCGDMEPSYLEFVGSALNVPLFFVKGNHDNHYADGEPGGENLHMAFRSYQGITMAGLEGSIFYNGQNVQYTEIQMNSMALRLLPRLMLHRRTHGYGVDYLVTHSPPKGIHDREDRTHQGFAAFLWLMRLARPRYLIHGHVDIWDRREVTETKYFDTKVININPKRLLLPDEDYLK